MDTVTIPATAQWCPYQPHYNPAQAIADHKRDIDNYNAMVQTAWDGSCALWAQQATYNRDYNVEPNPPPKPEPTTTLLEAHVQLVEAWVMPSTDPEVKTIEVVPSEPGAAAGFYMWDTPVPLPECPDLPREKQRP